MTKDEFVKKALEIVVRSDIAMVGSNGDEGYPNVKAMIKVEAVGIKTLWFSTNTSSKRTAQFLANPKACVYFVEPQNWIGLMLVGEIEVLQDEESRKRIWRDGCEIYYPQGVNDPDYSVFRFTAKWGNYYHGLKNSSFEIE